MADKKTGRPVGRPRKAPFPKMTQEEKLKLRNMIAVGASKEGLRMYYELSNDDFYDRFMKLEEVQEMFDKGKELRNTMIRIKQMQVAMDGNVPMLIHIGKTELGQVERTEVINNVDIKNNYDNDVLTKIAQSILNEKDV